MLLRLIRSLSKFPKRWLTVCIASSSSDANDTQVEKKKIMSDWTKAKDRETAAWNFLEKLDKSPKVRQDCFEISLVRKTGV
jgi:hypothetical protein